MEEAASLPEKQNLSITLILISIIGILSLALIIIEIWRREQNAEVNKQRMGNIPAECLALSPPFILRLNHEIKAWIVAIICRVAGAFYWIWCRLSVCNTS